MILEQFPVELNRVDSKSGGIWVHLQQAAVPEILLQDRASVKLFWYQKVRRAEGE